MSLLARRLRPSPFLRAAHHCLPRPAPASTSTATSTSAAPPAASVTADFVDALSKSLSSHMNTRAPPSGEIAAYIPQLAKADPESLGAAFCTVGGDLRSFGDDELPFSFQSCVKPFTYLAACEEHGLDYVHDHVGREPSGQAFNAFTLTSDDPPLPFNPMINAGAIAVCNLIGQKDRLSPSGRFERLENVIAQVGTDDGSVDFHTGFDNAVFMSERDTGFTNYALAHFMRSKQAAGSVEDARGRNGDVSGRSARAVEDDLQLYFQACSLTVDVRSAAVLAATLASGGVSPFTKKRRFAHRHVSSAIQLMFSCGMYDGSGAWACTVGLPAKSGVSGCIIVVVPNVLGLAVVSPPLNRMGNSARGVSLIESLAREFNLNIFSQLMLGPSDGVIAHLHEMSDMCDQLTR